MTSPRRTEPFEFAPAGVLRAASWPLEAITELDAPALAEHVLRDEHGSALEAAYAAQLEVSRARLWAQTAACPRFRAALALSSPALHSRLGAGELPARRNKRARHLETSLYRYLARAATRIEPFGLWTSVGLVHLEPEAAESTRAEPCPVRVRMAPELGPYRELLLRLAEREPYRARGPWRLNPTLGADTQDPSRWHYARRDVRSGTLRWTTLPAGLARPLSLALADHCGSRAQLRARLLLVTGEALADELLELAFRAGLFVGGLDLPLRYGDAWEALRLAGALLTDEHAAAWTLAHTRARELCVGLEQLLERDWGVLGGVAPQLAEQLGDAVLELERQLAELLAQLAETLGLPVPDAPRSWLRCDLGAAWSVHLGARDRAALTDLGRGWVELEHRYARGQLRERAARERLAAIPGGRLAAPPAQQSAAPAPASIDGRRLQAGPPLGAFVLRPGPGGLEAGSRRARLRGLSDVPTATHARHAYHLAALGDPVLPWLRTQLQELGGHGHALADLAYTHAGSPNLLARPCYVDALCGPWSAMPGQTLPHEAALVPGPQPGALLVDTKRGTMSLFSFTATVIPESDTILARAQLSSFDARGMRNAADTGSTPRATSPKLGELTLEPRRVELSPEQVEQLASVRRLPRYRRWLQLAATLELPELVRVTIEGRPGLVIPTCSPLALEAACEGLRDGARICVEEVVERGYLPCASGRHLAELVLPVRRHDHLWQTPVHMVEEPRAAG